MASPHEEFDPLADPEERRVLFAALDSFRQYRQAAHYNITHLRRQAFYSLPSAHVDILSEPPFSLPQTFRNVDDAIDSNADVAEAILEAGLSMYGIDPNDDSWKNQATPRDMDKARSTIRQLFRDWSDEGTHELEAVFGPIKRLLDEFLPHESDSEPTVSRYRNKILVPGAGLGRLVFDLIALGYSVEGNEISYHQLIASNYILNCTQQAAQHTLYPWALAFSNHLNRSDQLHAVKIPHVHLAAELEATSRASEPHYSERMSMSAGDFCVIYRQPEQRNTFHSVVTCFFLDTAPNVINYIETIKHCLAPGGVWINVGPLLWHFESAPTPAEKEVARSSAKGGHPNAQSSLENQGIADPGSFELSNDEVVALVQRLGFQILRHDESPDITAGYIQDSRSMLTNNYRPSTWVAKKIG